MSNKKKKTDLPVRPTAKPEDTQGTGSRELFYQGYPLIGKQARVCPHLGNAIRARNDLQGAKVFWDWISVAPQHRSRDGKRTPEIVVACEDCAYKANLFEISLNAMVIRIRREVPIDPAPAIQSPIDPQEPK